MDTAAPDNHPPAPIRIMVFAAERFGLSVPNNEIRSKQIIIDFQPYGTTKRFDEYNGVIVFQETFEHFSRYLDLTGMGGGLRCDCDINELEIRHKELSSLLTNKGFVVFLLHKKIEWGTSEKQKHSDLVKRYILWDNMFTQSIQREPTGLIPKRDELHLYCSRFAVASTSFTFHGEMQKHAFPLISHPLHGIVSFSLASSAYFLPARIPKPHETSEFFELLTKAIVSIHKKDRLAIPVWASEFMISGEDECRRTLVELEKQKSNLNSQLETYDSFKHILCSTSQRLVKDVANLLKNGLGLSLDETDNGREDLKILGDNNRPFVFVEVKGVNGNVTREQVNQADSHRERAGLSETFPSLLIINTCIHSARSLKEKDTPPPLEQIVHAE